VEDRTTTLVRGTREKEKDQKRNNAIGLDLD
jgi:hypothetical protein